MYNNYNNNNSNNNEKKKKENVARDVISTWIRAHELDN